ncbi:MAG: hypothetical protein JF607_09465 [Burkholderiales bacterium]|jgi:hypothetical protein|nr:hypothetical protein [Burkholderiales bacterium]
MQFPKSMHADGWHAHMPVQRALPGMEYSGDEASWSLQRRRRFHVLALAATAALVALAGLNVVDDPRPLDVQLSSAMHKAGDTLRDWQGQLSRGLQVSLRAVADGRDSLRAEAGMSSTRKTPASDSTVVAQAASATVDTSDQHQPVRADLAPRQPQPSLPTVDR